MFSWSSGEKQKIKNQIHETKVKVRSSVHCVVILPVSSQITGGEVGVQNRITGPRVEEIHAACRDARPKSAL